MTRTIYQASLEAKGWTIDGLARHWGISTRQMRNIAARPQQRDWDALEGAHDLTEQQGCHVREEGRWRSKA